MKYLSVCSGIEAATCAWHPLGWQPWAFSEIEPFPCAVLKHYYPNVPNLGDMTKFKDWPDGSIDLLVGGTPCQSFSVAGLRKGLADPRGNLMLTYLAIAAKYRPKWLVWENVPGVLSSNGGKDFGALLGGLAELGYGFAYRIFDAQYVGVPQRRRRVFVVGCFGDWRSAASVLFERHSLSGNPPPSRQAGQNIAPTISARTKGGGRLGTDFDCDGGLIPTVSPTLRAGGNKTGGDRPPGTDVDTADSLITVPVSFDLAQITSAANRTRVSPELPVSTLNSKGQIYAAYGFQPRIARNGRGDMGDLVASLNAQSGETGKGDAAPCVAITFQERGRADGPCLDIGGEVAYALTAPKGGGRAQERNILTPAMQVRRLTPRECERLQGFPDDYTLIPVRGKDAADSPRYRALGNSMAVPCMRWLGQRIESVGIHECHGGIWRAEFSREAVAIEQAAA